MSQLFQIIGGKGFCMEFPNGWTISVQIGDSNYHAHRYEQDSEFSIISVGSERVLVSDYLSGSKGSPNAEIAVYKGCTDKTDSDTWLALRKYVIDDEIYTETVAGWVGTVAIAAIMGKLAQYPTDACPEVVGEEIRAILESDK